MPAKSSQVLRRPGLLLDWPQRLYQELCLACFDRAENPRNLAAPMTMSVVHAAEEIRPMRGLLPLWVGFGVYALFLYGEKFFVNHNAAS